MTLMMSLLIALILPILTACGGGGLVDAVDVSSTELPEDQRSTTEGQPAEPQIGERQTLQGPGPHPGVVSTEPLVFGLTGLSPRHLYSGFTYIGSDVIPRIPLKTIDVSTTSSFRLSFGTLRDGMGDQRVRDYLANFDDIHPFRAGIHPRLRFPTGTTFDEAYETFQASQILNAALPPESWITYTLDDPAPTLSLLSSSTTIEEGDILVYHVSSTVITLLCGTDALACAYPLDGSHIEPSAANRYASIIVLPNNLEPDVERKVAVHEIMHALSFSGHTDSIQFPDSLMGTAGDYFAFPGYVIHDIDREALQAVYLSNYRNYNDLDTWDDATFHIRGDIYDTSGYHVASFGTAMRNGLPQPGLSVRHRPRRCKMFWGYQALPIGPAILSGSIAKSCQSSETRPSRYPLLPSIPRVS